MKRPEEESALSAFAASILNPKAVQAAVEEKKSLRKVWVVTKTHKYSGITVASAVYSNKEAAMKRVELIRRLGDVPNVEECEVQDVYRNGGE